ncbi:MAG: glycerate kinase [Bacteroidales bacterium]|nr:glycerate kinase [Bacteroidales bacterium]
MKIVVASDSFKGCLSSEDIGSAARSSILELHPDWEVVPVQVADGGEGTVDAVVSGCGGSKIGIEVCDPLMRRIRASYGYVPDRRLAVLEMSAASGLSLLSEEERNPAVANTFGTGQMILDAVGRGCRDILMGIGGSATNDGGLGMLCALGFRFLDKDGNELPGTGESLGKIVSVDAGNVPEAVLETRFRVACDVDTPFCGRNGAAYVFAPQKGADAEMVRTLDEAMCSFAGLVLSDYGIDLRITPGTGAAGGLGAALLVFLKAELLHGIEMILDAIGFDSIIEGADLIITGEGSIDSQTLKGKTPFGVLKAARKKGIPVVALCGKCSDRDLLMSAGFTDIRVISPADMPLEEAMKPETASGNVRMAVSEIIS